MSAQPLSPEVLLHAYMQGIFPMSEHRDDPEVFWVDPKRRGVFPLDHFHISRSLARSIRKADFRVAINQDFSGVVTACADRQDTWINETIFDLYGQLFTMGFAHSLEIRRESDLIGGVYGVAIGGAFFGESMFSRATNGSKIALAFLVDRLRRTGFQLFDTQFQTAHLASLGAQEISRTEYHRRLRRALILDADFASGLPIPEPQDVLQRNTQTSYRG